jgi:hypothetical protein
MQVEQERNFNSWSRIRSFAKTRRSGKTLRSEIRTVDSLSEIEVRRMYQLFVEYYDGHNFATFQKDLLEKDHVILLRDSKDGTTQGFSTLMRVTLSVSGKTIRGVYSGDTALNTQYWGSTALGKAFLQYLWKEQTRNFGTPIYWFLISKGYKTYLMMANNFHSHWPRVEAETPVEIKKIMDAFYLTKFGSDYYSPSGLIHPTGLRCRLKQKVAGISHEMLKQNTRINFFQNKNPDWNDGVELCCLAKMTLAMPFQFALKKISLFSKSKSKSKSKYKSSRSTKDALK